MRTSRVRGPLLFALIVSCLPMNAQSTQAQGRSPLSLKVRPAFDMPSLKSCSTCPNLIHSSRNVALLIDF